MLGPLAVVAQVLCSVLVQVFLCLQPSHQAALACTVHICVSAPVREVYMGRSVQYRFTLIHPRVYVYRMGQYFETCSALFIQLGSYSPPKYRDAVWETGCTYFVALGCHVPG